MPLAAFDQALSIIQAEAQALQTLAEQLDAAGVEAVTQAIMETQGRVILTGVGKSGIIAAKIAATLSSTGTPASFMHMADAGHGDLGMVGRDDFLIILSNSGQSRELIPVLTYCNRLNIPIAAITAKADSMLARAARYVLMIPSVVEACPLGLAPMSSTTMQLALGDALAGALIIANGFSREDFGKRHMSGSLGLRTMTVSEFLKAQDSEHGENTVPIVDQGAQFTDVIDTITAGRLGATLVQHDTGYGIITDGDIRRAMGQQRFDIKAKDIMTANPVIMSASALLVTALASMHEKSISVLIVQPDDTLDDAKHGSDLPPPSPRLLHIHDLLKLGI